MAHAEELRGPADEAFHEARGRVAIEALGPGRAGSSRGAERAKARWKG